MSKISLKTLLVPTKAVEVEYPGMPGFKINVCFLSREELVKIRKKATKTEYKNRQPIDTLNDELFLQLYVDASIKGWSGLTLTYVSQLVPVDLSGQDTNDTLDFSPEDALMLMKNSANFDSFISETVTDLANFPQSSGEKSVSK